jgi:hypothetical protein
MLKFKELKKTLLLPVAPSCYMLFVLWLVTQQIELSSSCDIVGASACTHKPDKDLKEENFDEYCEKYKQHLECVYSKYKGCDKKEKYVEAMESMIKGLRKKAKQIETLCEMDIDIGEEEVKKVNNSQDVRLNGYATAKQRPTTTTTPCKINLISPECHSILTNAQFSPTWNGVMKQKWCNSAGPYYNCLKVRLVNCYGVQYAESVAYYEKIQKYIHSQANINCPGGLEGCIGNPNDVRCKMGVKYGETSGGGGTSTTFNKHSNYLFVFLFKLTVFWLFYD